MKTYEGLKTKEISFPLGGIGTGSIGLGGNGRLFDWEIFNKPNKGSINGYTHIAVRAKNSSCKTFAKVLNGDYIKDYTGQYSKGKFHGFGYGPRAQTMAGFPHFKNSTFVGEFPFANIKFQDEMFPGDVSLIAFNPFIPLDDFNSSLPAAFFDVEFCNPTDETVTYETAFSVMNPFSQSKNVSTLNNEYPMIKMINTGDNANSPSFGDLTIGSDCEKTVLQEYWYRGKWQDGLVTFWQEFSSGSELKQRSYESDGTYDMCTLLGGITLKPHEKGSIKFILSWNIPNNYNYWNPLKNDNGEDITWKNYYATVFKSSAETADYCLKNWKSLYDKTLLFKDSLHSSTLDEAVIDSVSANLAVLKSPTVLRLDDGSFYGWEGVHELEGSCEGTCSHVWNYAYALCFLFPNLERSIRDLEFKYSLDDKGKLNFRLPLPVGRHPKNPKACVDGQMGAIIKTYREWKLSGDNQWLSSNWANLEKALEFAWSPDNSEKWDADKDGVLEGQQHHTLDMELFGPSSWLEGFYLTALKAAAEMAEHLGKKDKSTEYMELFQKGYEWTKNNLFNGSYFIQKIDLKDNKTLKAFDAMDYWNEEVEEIKYQIGDGCEIDQICAQWHANICGLGDIFDNAQRKTALGSLFKNNFKSSLRDFANPWRIFSLNDESGAIICDYPKGAYKPVIPIPYCEEAMHGFEYQLAGLLISEGMIDEGLSIVRSVRDRYDGEKRNPWNEIECGSNYARSMASFALLPIFSGFIFDLPNKRIGFNPIINKNNFSCFWSAGGAWGTFELNETKAVIKIHQGNIRLKQLILPFARTVSSLVIDGENTPFDLSGGTIAFHEMIIAKEVEIQLK